jgi:hypothetical protein
LTATDLFGNETAALNASVKASLYEYAETVANTTGNVIDVPARAKIVS